MGRQCTDRPGIACVWADLRRCYCRVWWPCNFGALAANSLRKFNKGALRFILIETTLLATLAGRFLLSGALRSGHDPRHANIHEGQSIAG
jgi:hypothetical protein